MKEKKTVNNMILSVIIGLSIILFSVFLLIFCWSEKLTSSVKGSGEGLEVTHTEGEDSQKRVTKLEINDTIWQQQIPERRFDEKKVTPVGTEVSTNIWERTTYFHM